MKWFLELFRDRCRRRYLTAEDDPVLARIWDNEADAIYDDWAAASLEGLERWEAKHGLGKGERHDPKAR